MRHYPRLMPKSLGVEAFGGVTYHVEGDVVPMLTVDVSHRSVYFEHPVLLWKHPSVSVAVKSMSGRPKRPGLGGQVYMTQASGPGSVAVSRDRVGQIVPIHLTRGRSVYVREHRFLAATDTVENRFERVQGLSETVSGGTVVFADKFESGRSEGVLWLHGYGNVFELTLATRESIDVDPGGWLYHDATVLSEARVDRLAHSGLAGLYVELTRFTGPGRVGIQSMSVSLETPG